MEATSSRRRRYEMPAQPFKELLEHALVENRVDGLARMEEYVNDGLLTPLEQVCDRLANNLHRPYESTYKRVYELLAGKVKTINFDFADAIVCITVGPWFWYSDDRVKDLYEAIGA